jgi:hypothetical protein
MPTRATSGSVNVTMFQDTRWVEPEEIVVGETFDNVFCPERTGTGIPPDLAGFRCQFAA